MEKFIILFREERGVKYVNYQFDTVEAATAFAQQRKYADFLVVTQAEFEEYRSGIKQQQQQIFTSTTYQTPRTRVNIEEYEPDEEITPVRQPRPIIYNYKPHFIRRL